MENKYGVEFYWSVEMRLIGHEDFVEFYRLETPDAVAAVLKITLEHASNHNEEVRVVRRIKI